MSKRDPRFLLRLRFAELKQHVLMPLCARIESRRFGRLLTSGPGTGDPAKSRVAVLENDFIAARSTTSTRRRGSSARCTSAVTHGAGPARQVDVKSHDLSNSNWREPVESTSAQPLHVRAAFMREKFGRRRWTGRRSTPDDVQRRRRRRAEAGSIRRSRSRRSAARSRFTAFPGYASVSTALVDASIGPP